MTYLLDSNVWIVALRHPGSTLVGRFQAADPADIRKGNPFIDGRQRSSTDLSVISVSSVARSNGQEVIAAVEVWPQRTRRTPRQMRRMN
jgi:hypothetical protein